MSKTFEVIFKEFHNSETFVMSRSLLEDYKRQAAQEERQRIVELLEQLHDSFIDDYGHTHESVAVSNVIAAIKGEQNEKL